MGRITKQELSDELKTEVENGGVASDAIGDRSALKTEDKTNLVAAVNELFTSASNGKTNVAAAITGKGVPTSSSDTFGVMATNIKNIKVGDYSVGDQIPTMKIDLPVIRSQYQHRYGVITKPKCVTGRGIYGYYSSDTELIKVDASKEALEIWKLTLPASFGYNSIGCDDEGELFIYHAGELIRKNPSNGADVWTSKNPSFVFQDIRLNRIMFDKDHVYVATSAETMTKFRKTDGSVVWSSPLSVNVAYLTKEKDYIYFAQMGTIYSISTLTGALQSILGLTGLNHYFGAVVVGNKIYANSTLTDDNNRLRRYSMTGIAEKQSGDFKTKSPFVFSSYGFWVSMDGAYAENLKLLDRDLNEVTRGYQFGDNMYGGVNGRFIGTEIDKDGNLFYLMGTGSASNAFGRDTAKVYYNVL